MADFKGRKRGKSDVQNMGIFLVAQDVVLSHRAKFQLIINFFRVKAISTGLEVIVDPSHQNIRLESQSFLKTTKICQVRVIKTCESGH